MAQGCVRLRLCFTDSGDKHSAIFHDSLSASSTLKELENRVVCKSTSFAVSLPLTFLDPRKGPGSDPVVLSDVQDLREAYEAMKASSKCSTSSASIIPLQRITVHVPVSIVASTSSAPRGAIVSAKALQPSSKRASARPAAAAASCSETSASASNQMTQRLINNILLAVRQHDFTAAHSRARAAAEPRVQSAAVLQRPVAPRVAVKRTSSSMSSQHQDGDDEDATPQHCRRHLSTGAVSPALCSSLA